MDLINSELRKKIEENIIPALIESKYERACRDIEDSIGIMYDLIPQEKRISYGIVHTVKTLGKLLFELIEKNNSDAFECGSGIFNYSKVSESKVVGLTILSFYGLKFPEKVFPLFRKAAADEDWEVREIVQILFRKLIKKYPENSRVFLLSLVSSEDPNIRRFVGETLRPVCENKWFYKNTDYPLSVISNLFSESKPYPRTSVGNNLSDLARYNPDLIYKLVEKLVESGDRNSYWIAYRACRNLVKKDPEKVMNLLKTNIYKYKDRIHESEKTEVEK